MSLTNFFFITNLSDLKCKYRLFRIKGLPATSEDYDKNVQLLTDKLSRITKSPCEAIKENDDLFIALPVGRKDPPSEFIVVRNTVLIEPTDIERELKYDSLRPEDERLSLRFLKFFLDGPLQDNKSLWRPGAGKPFYKKIPFDKFSSGYEEVEAYRGFKFRPMILDDRRIVICVDLSTAYASSDTLPNKMTQDDLRRFRGKHCIYEYVDNWYEIRITGLNDLNVSEVQIPQEKQSLFAHLHSKSKFNKPKNLHVLPKDASVFTYRTGTGDIRNAPTGLCRLVCHTSNSAVRDFHRRSIMDPEPRKKEIEFVVSKYLKPITFLGIPIQLSDEMHEMETERFTPPDLEFGNRKILSVRGTNNANKINIQELGYAKKKMLYSSEAGFYTQKPLDKQYLILPKSMVAKFADAYLKDLQEQFQRIYGSNYEYVPSLVSYDDSVRRSVYVLGNEIVNKAQANCMEPGFALVIIPTLRDKKSQKEDELASFVMSELKKSDVPIYASVAHTTIPSRSYVQTITHEGQTIWNKTNDFKQQKRLGSYLANVSLNKILLLNSCLPFVLSQHLHADLTIGIDTKNTTAGFTMMHKDGKTISFRHSNSSQKVKLSKKHLSKKIYEILKEELENEELQIKKIVIHRDGPVFDDESSGIYDGLKKLAQEKYIDSDFDCNIVEIRKTSFLPVRFFEKEETNSFNEKIQNPWVGTYKILGNNAFLCNTGRPYSHKGTTNPIQVTKVTGNMTFREILQDIFDLSNLTWTKIDDCARDPITIKMTDIRLREIAGEYDEDEFEFAEVDTLE